MNFFKNGLSIQRVSKNNIQPPNKDNINIQQPNTIEQIKSFASAMISRGFSDNVTDLDTKRLRVASCFGTESVGGNIGKCPALNNSATEGKHFCGACGCGDKEGTWLIAESQKYSKLDYPKLSCPLNMPGFSNYIPVTIEKTTDNDSRKKMIESLAKEDLDKLSVTLPEVLPKDQANQKT